MGSFKHIVNKWLSNATYGCVPLTKKQIQTLSILVIIKNGDIE